MNTNHNDQRFVISLSTLALLLVPFACHGAESDYYTEEQVYQSRPDPARDTPFGCIGATGLMTRIYPGVTVKVEQTMPGSPAAGKFSKGEIITGINGVALKGLNPFVTLGNALTKAEASDGRMVFDVTSADGKAARKETVSIPVLGAYGETWPLDCNKSKKIIEQAAGFYADPKKFNEGGIPGALACLFLLSTGDDKYLPRVKAYFDAFPKDVRQIGDHTWNNGYNGIACGEYYLRTGDAAVLPILQYYCDDAKERQKFGCGWTHWGRGVHPGYVAGGLMNPAGAQVLTTLLLGKECGVDVDEETLLGALRFFYRFAGHGTVHAALFEDRPEGLAELAIAIHQQGAGQPDPIPTGPGPVRQAVHTACSTGWPGRSHRLSAAVWSLGPCLIPARRSARRPARPLSAQGPRAGRNTMDKPRSSTWTPIRSPHSDNCPPSTSMSPFSFWSFIRPTANRAPCPFCAVTVRSHCT